METADVGGGGGEGGGEAGREPCICLRQCDLGAGGGEDFSQSVPDGDGEGWKQSIEGVSQVFCSIVQDKD